MRPSTGRAELLNWINTLCVANYSTVTHLSDCVLYCQVIEMMTAKSSSSPTAAPVLDRLPYFDCNADDFGDDLIDHGRAGVGRPVVNARQLADRRLQNCKYLEQLMRSTVPSKWGQQIDPDRLSSGKLQDHMVLLAHLNKWFCSHVNAGHQLAFVSDPVERRYRAALSHSHQNIDVDDQILDSYSLANLASSKIGPSLQIPQSAPVRDAHIRFLESIGVSNDEDDMQQPQPQHQLSRPSSSHTTSQKKQQQQQRPSSSSSKNNNKRVRQQQEEMLQQSILQDHSFSEINSHLDDAAIQLEARREQLERDAMQLKKLVEERDRMKLKLRKAYENLIISSNQQQQQQHFNNNNHQKKDPCAGFKMDIERLFQDASNGRGANSAASVLFKALSQQQQQQQQQTFI